MDGVFTKNREKSNFFNFIDCIWALRFTLVAERGSRTTRGVQIYYCRHPIIDTIHSMGLTVYTCNQPRDRLLWFLLRVSLSMPRISYLLESWTGLALFVLVCCLLRSTQLTS
jgi:hypothetical protein